MMMPRTTELVTEGGMSGFWFEFFLPHLAVSILFGLISLYVFMYLASDSGDLVSGPRAMRTLKEIPNLIVTSLSVLVRILPWFLLGFALMLPVIFIGMQGSEYNPNALIVPMILMYIPVLWGTARLMPSVYITITTRYRFWSSTRKSVELFRNNRLILLSFLLPMLLTVLTSFLFVIPRTENSLTLYDTAAAAQAGAYSGAVFSPGWYALTAAVGLIVYAIYMFGYSALIRLCFSPEERREAPSKLSPEQSAEVSTEESE
ncbi:hypothetical protein L21SP2_1527 [Salinispira pacifica]|uniref:Uncharacterized protein n=2 Tax=Salinispira pacifica TaxID=1307761 RepID=V5WH12_9SPIO|nr:hypothetical protein L21SP2_1527 [Salinispira pacifica]